MAMRKCELKSDPFPLYVRPVCSPLQPDANSGGFFFFLPCSPMLHKILWGYSEC